jgi:hypothetical protein
VVGLTFAVMNNYWIITKATFTKTQHVFIGTITGTAEMDYSNFAFPSTAPNPALAGTPRPAPTSAPASTATPTGPSPDTTTSP